MDAEAQRSRLPIGQLLGNLLRLFRAELAARGESLEDAVGIRPAHLHVFGTIKANGSRLTDLASRSNLSLSSIAELVDDLERLGYLERLPDPRDRRAKLVCLTERGWRAMNVGREVITAIEADWTDRLGRERFESMCEAAQDLLDQLDPQVSAGYIGPVREIRAQGNPVQPPP